MTERNQVLSESPAMGIAPGIESKVALDASPVGETAATQRNLLEWQIALLPMMSLMLVGLTLFFFIASFVQLSNLHNRIAESPSTQLREIVAMIDNEVHQTSSEVLRAGELQILATLEGYALDRRYHQANVLLMSRVWARYLGFVTGMILALVGCSFILGKMRSKENRAEIGAGPVTAAFQGTEPGLILAGLGVALMMTTIITHHNIEVKDAPTFMQVWMQRNLGDEGEKSLFPSTRDSESTENDTVAPLILGPLPESNQEQASGATESSQTEQPLPEE